MPRLSLTHVLNMTRVFIWDSKPQKSVQCAKEKGSTSVSFPWFEFLGCAQWRLFERGIEAHHQGLTKSTSNSSATLRLVPPHTVVAGGRIHWKAVGDLRDDQKWRRPCSGQMLVIVVILGFDAGYEWVFVSLGECQECLKENLYGLTSLNTLIQWKHELCHE